MALNTLLLDIPQEPRHPIQVVVRRTGLSADVIRAWERRYSAIAPTRDTNSRRLYSETDISKLIMLQRATSAGRRISEVVGLPLAELTVLVETDESAAAQSQGRRFSRPSTGSVMEYFDECLEAIDSMDPVAFNLALDNAAQALDIPFLLEDLLRPFIHHVRDECRRGSMRLSQEKMATSMVRCYLSTLASSERPHASGPKLIVTTPLGQHYDLIALRLAVAANSYGWNTVYLGTSTPYDDIAFSLERSGSSAVALGIVRPVDDPHLPNELRRLRERLPHGTPVLISASALSGYSEVIEEIDAISIQSMGEMRLELDRIRQTLINPLLS